MNIFCSLAKVNENEKSHSFFLGVDVVISLVASFRGGGRIDTSGMSAPLPA